MAQREDPCSFHKCTLCTKRSKDFSVILKHIREVHRKPPRTDSLCESNLEPHKCRYCKFQTNLNVSLKNHIDIAHNNLQIDHNLQNLLQGYCCRKCHLSTFSIFIWARHVCKRPTISEKNQNKPFKCAVCPYQFSRAAHLRSHIMYKHTLEEEIKWFKCKHCSYKGKIKSALKTHMLNKHTVEKNIEWKKCNYCTYKTKLNYTLKTHIINKHTSEENIKWLKCNYCSYKAKLNPQLNEHIKTKHTSEDDMKWFKCGQCSYKTNQSGNLQRHIIDKHTSEENIKWFKCKYCSHKSKQKVNMEKHSRTHFGRQR